MKNLPIAGAVLALSLGLTATGCKKKMSGPGVADPGSEGATDSGGCCGAAASADGAMVPLGLVVLGLARTRRRRGR